MQKLIGKTQFKARLKKLITDKIGHRKKLLDVRRPSKNIPPLTYINIMSAIFSNTVNTYYVIAVYLL